MKKDVILKQEISSPKEGNFKRKINQKFNWYYLAKRTWY